MIVKVIHSIPSVALLPMDQDMLPAYHTKGAAGGYAKDVLALNRGKPMWGTFWVWDARLTSVFILFFIYLGALRFQKLSVEPAPISIRAGPIDIPIIKSSVNWWNTLHQPGSISRSGISIHVSMPIPILSNFANSPFSTRILFVLETRLPIPSFLESLLTEEIEALEGIPKPISLAESFCIHV
ncbi:putative cytochrome c biosynthesis ccmC-like mitochondrial protein [Capsicum annuum]|nr:putative cytochrome c biosynthesis ccmC-like mitochondrial protein [Capsicum annuum]KAF3679967.1 putative cytochrome c biosynthesis ccmC-like mitochondrial protein [Capsicum annuum]